MYNKENYFGHGALLLCGLSFKNFRFPRISFLLYGQSFKKVAFTLIKTVTLNRNQQPTKEQIQQIEAAAKKDIVFDEDSPALTPAMEKAFRLAAKNRNTQKKTGVS